MPSLMIFNNFFNSLKIDIEPQLKFSQHFHAKAGHDNITYIFYKHVNVAGRGLAILLSLFNEPNREPILKSRTDPRDVFAKERQSMPEKKTNFKTPKMNAC